MFFVHGLLCWPEAKPKDYIADREPKSMLFTYLQCNEHIFFISQEIHIDTCNLEVELFKSEFLYCADIQIAS